MKSEVANVFGIKLHANSLKQSRLMHADNSHNGKLLQCKYFNIRLIYAE